MADSPVTDHGSNILQQQAAARAQIADAITNGQRDYAKSLQYTRADAPVAKAIEHLDRAVEAYGALDWRGAGVGTSHELLLDSAAQYLDDAKLVLRNCDPERAQALEYYERKIRQARAAGTLPDNVSGMKERLGQERNAIKIAAVDSEKRAMTSLNRAVTTADNLPSQTAAQVKSVLQNMQSDMERELQRAINVVRNEAATAAELALQQSRAAILSKTVDPLPAARVEQLRLQNQQFETKAPTSSTPHPAPHPAPHMPSAATVSHVETQAASKIFNKRTGLGLAALAGAGWFVKKNIDWAKERSAYEQRIRELQEANPELQRQATLPKPSGN